MATNKKNLETTETVETTETEEMVTIKLPKERGEDSVWVSVNDRLPLQIKRGVAVEVPVWVAEAIENSEKQRDAAYDYLDSVTAK